LPRVWSSTAVKLLYPAENLDISQINWEDRNLYLKGCLFKIKTPETKGKFEWGKINFCVDDGIYLNDNLEEEDAIDSKKVEIDFTFPRSGVYNYKNSTLVFQRTHRRQWRKGICNDTCLFFNPLERYYGGNKEILTSLRETPSGFKFSSKVMKELFDSAFPSFARAYLSVKKNKVLSRAVCPELFISIGANGSLPIFWCGLTPVGVVWSPTKIQVNSHEFVPIIQGIFQEIGEKNVGIEQVEISV
jgi:hypothetical protein